MLALAGTLQCFAQDQDNSTKKSTSKAEQIFSPDPSILTHKFTINLNKGNKVIVAVPTRKTLQELSNIDSIFMQALKDLQPLYDSLQKEVNSKKVDYVIDTNGNKKIRITDYPPLASTYSIKENNISALKTEQDTLRITGMLKKFKMNYTTYDPIDQQLYWQLTFAVNNLNEVHTYLNGTLNKTMGEIVTNYVTPEILNAKYEKWGDIAATYYPYENKPLVTPGRNPFTLSLPFLEASMQTFGHTVAPSISVGIHLEIRKTKVTHYFIQSWEPVFFFERDSKGKLSSFRNDFTTLQYRRIKNNVNYDRIGTFYAYSFSYLTNDNRRGEYFEKSTFKIGLPGFKYKALTVQPQFIFNDFLKNVSPGFKVSVGF